jgi:hypothetical protein
MTPERIKELSNYGGYTVPFIEERIKTALAERDAEIVELLESKVQMWVNSGKKSEAKRRSVQLGRASIINELITQIKELP